MIAIELALAVVVLALAGFLTRSVMSLNAVDIGLNDRGVIAFSVALPPSAYPRPDRIAAFRDGVVDQLERIPGVSGVAVSSALPVGETIPGVVLPTGSASPAEYRPAAVYAVTADFARTIGIAVKAGRFFEDIDRAGTPAAVLNETLARTMWPNDNPIGRPVSVAPSLPSH